MYARRVPTNPGELIRDARKRAGMKQETLAHKLGTTQEVISRYETGKSVPTVARLAEMLDVMGEELVLGSRPKKPVAGKGSNILYLPR